MATEAKKSGFMMWYESYQGKKVVNMVYCLGASVVIIGALFKIMHFPGAGPLLMTGMCTEAILFAIGCFDKPHVDFHWQNVFPQLIGYGADPKELEELASKPRPTLLGSGSEAGSNATADNAKKANVPALSDKEFEALKGSINDLANTAAQLSELGKIAEKTNKLSEKMDAAGAAADKFIGSQEGITSASATFAKNLETSSSTFAKNMETSSSTFAKNMETSSNSFVKTIESSSANLNQKMENAAVSLVKGVDASTSSLQSTMQSIAEVIGKKNTDLTNAYATVVTEMQTVANSSKNFEQQVGTINQKLATLNSVYELQINAVQSQANAFNTQTTQVNTLSQTIQKIQTATTEAAKAGEEYQAAANKLNQQVADLNKIYGNMLTALN